MIRYNFLSTSRIGIARAGASTFSTMLLLALAAPLVSGMAQAQTTSQPMLTVGDVNGDNSLNIAAGAIYQVEGKTRIGLGAGATGTISVQGISAQLQAAGGLFIGDGGNGTLTVGGAGLVNVTGANSLVGTAGGAGLVTVSGPGSAWRNAGGIIIGDTSGGAVSSGTVSVLSGAVVSSASGVLMNNALAQVSDAGSAWNVAGNLDVGTDGSGELKILQGAHVSSGTSGIGVRPSLASGNATAPVSGKVTVSGAGSQFAVAGLLQIGPDNSDPSGSHGVLAISGGGSVTAGNLSAVGNGTSGSMALSEITVDGAGSSLAVNGDMSIGLHSNMLVSNGGVASAANGSILGASTSVVVTDAGSRWNMTGVLKQEGILTVARGGMVSAGQKIEIDGSGGVLNIGAAAGQAAMTAGSVSTPSIVNGGAIILNHTDTNYALSAAISGTGMVGVYSGTSVLTSVNSYTGATTLYGGTLKAGVNNAFSAASAHDVRSGAALDLAGYNQTVNNLINAGTIWLNRGYGSAVAASLGVNSGPGTVLTVQNYVGNGGTLVFNTVLGDSSSATDRLVIDGGSATGSTNVLVNNAGGLGAQTTGDGILLISAINGGTTNVNAFSLQGGHVSAGAYDYTLVRGGVAAGSADNWYLSSNLIVPVTPPAGGGLVPSNGGGLIPSAGGDRPAPSGGSEDDRFKKEKYLTVNSGSVAARPAASPARTGGIGGATYIVVPNYRAEASLAAAVAPLSIEYGYAMLGTLHERVGDNYVRRAAPVYEERVVRDSRGNRTTSRVAVSSATARDQTFFGGWARLIGDKSVHESKNFLKSGPDYNYTSRGVQAGFDGYGREQAGSLDKVGVYLGYGQVNSNVKGVLRTRAGSVDMAGLSVGGYWTHKSAQGWYTDAVVQGTWYSADTTSVRGLKLKPDSFGAIASLEGGYALRLGAGLSLEPQAQLAYQNVSFGNAQDPYGRFNWANADSWRGRIGARLAQEWSVSDGYRPIPVTAWLRANLWHEFAGKSEVTITNSYGYNPATLSSALGGTWGEVGAGISGQLSEEISVFSTAGYNHSLDNNRRESWDGRIGATLKW